MGLIEFVRDAGKKLGVLPRTEVSTPPDHVPGDVDSELANARFAAELAAEVARLGFPIEALDVSFDGGTATVRGTAPSQDVREKAVLTVGNIEGVAEVDDQLEVVEEAEEARFVRVHEGDSLSRISLRVYGVIPLYERIFEANQPMLSDPDEIYPGQVLRIPPVERITHTVARGETLGAIAKHWYGNAARYEQIYEANRDRLASPDRVEVGQELVIPLAEHD